MGNYILIIVLAAVVSVATLLHSARSSTASADRQLARHAYKSVIAREAAITGLNLTLRRLITDTTRWSDDPDEYGFSSVPYRNARFTTVIQAGYQPGPLLDQCAIDTVDVLSIGSPDADTTGSRDHRIETTYVRRCRRLITKSKSVGAILGGGWSGPTSETESDTSYKSGGVGLLELAEW